MDPRRQISLHLKDWLELTLLESHFVQSGRWGELLKIQKNKAALQQPLAGAIEEWRKANPAEALSNPFYTALNRLLQLESRNSELLAVRKREVREKILLLEQALFDLHQVRPAALTSEAA